MLVYEVYVNEYSRSYLITEGEMMNSSKKFTCTSALFVAAIFIAFPAFAQNYGLVFLNGRAS